MNPIKAGRLPFNFGVESLDYDKMIAHAYKAPLNADGVAILPVDWDDDDATQPDSSVSLVPRQSSPSPLQF